MLTLRDLLARCPDEAPSPSIAELSFIQDTNLRDSIRSDISAANRALHDGQWKAATVLAGAATGYPRRVQRFWVECLTHAWNIHL